MLFNSRISTHFTPVFILGVLVVLTGCVEKDELSPLQQAELENSIYYKTPGQSLVQNETVDRRQAISGLGDSSSVVVVQGTLKPGSWYREGTSQATLQSGSFFALAFTEYKSSDARVRITPASEFLVNPRADHFLVDGIVMGATFSADPDSIGTNLLSGSLGDTATKKAKFRALGPDTSDNNLWIADSGIRIRLTSDTSDLRLRFDNGATVSVDDLGKPSNSCDSFMNPFDFLQVGLFPAALPDSEVRASGLCLTMDSTVIDLSDDYRARTINALGEKKVSRCLVGQTGCDSFEVSTHMKIVADHIRVRQDKPIIGTVRVVAVARENRPEVTEDISVSVSSAELHTAADVSDHDFVFVDAEQPIERVRVLAEASAGSVGSQTPEAYTADNLSRFRLRYIIPGENDTMIQARGGVSLEIASGFVPPTTPSLVYYKKGNNTLGEGTGIIRIEFSDPAEITNLAATPAISLAISNAAFASESINWISEGVEDPNTGDILMLVATKSGADGKLWKANLTQGSAFILDASTDTSYFDLKLALGESAGAKHIIGSGEKIVQVPSFEANAFEIRDFELSPVLSIYPNDPLPGVDFSSSIRAFGSPLELGYVRMGDNTGTPPADTKYYAIDVSETFLDYVQVGSQLGNGFGFDSGYWKDQETQVFSQFIFSPTFQESAVSAYGLPDSWIKHAEVPAMLSYSPLGSGQVGDSWMTFYHRGSDIAVYEQTAIPLITDPITDLSTVPAAYEIPPSEFLSLPDVDSESSSYHIELRLQFVF